MASRLRIRRTKDRKRIIAATNILNARIRQIKDGTVTREDDTRTQVDITKNIRSLYTFLTNDRIFRQLMGILKSDIVKNGPTFGVPDGIGATFQTAFLRDTEVTRHVTEILFSAHQHIEIYKFCFFYVFKDMDNWVRKNLNEPMFGRNSVPFRVINPTEGEYYVERKEGEINYSLYFVPNDESVLDTYYVVLYEEDPSFDVVHRNPHRDVGFRTTDTLHAMTQTNTVQLSSPFQGMLEEKMRVDEAIQNECNADKWRVDYVDYVTPPIPKELDLDQMQQQQIIMRGALNVGSTNPNLPQNDHRGYGSQEVTFSEFTSRVYQAGISAGNRSAAPPAPQSKKSRIMRLGFGETVNRNPHANLIRSATELEKRYTIGMCAELGVPYSLYRPFEKGATRKDDNISEAEMMMKTVHETQQQMASIFFILYEHTLGVLDEKMLDAYRKWETDIAFGPDDINFLSALGTDGTSPENDMDANENEDKESHSAKARERYLMSQISQLTAFDIGMLSYMNAIEIPDGEFRHLVTIEFAPSSTAATTSIADYIMIYKEGILRNEIVAAIRSRLELPEDIDASDNETSLPSPSKRARKAPSTTTKKKI